MALSIFRQESIFRKEYVVLVIGKSNSGKSALCNSLLGRREFEVHHSLDVKLSNSRAATRILDRHEGQVTLKVIDTPDVFSLPPDTFCERENILTLLQPHSTPHVVLIVVPSDQRFLNDDYQLYNSMRRMLNSRHDDFWDYLFYPITRYFGHFNISERNLVAAFTRGDRLVGTVATTVEKAGPNLQNVFSDCQGRNIVFRQSNPDKPADSGEMDQLLDIIETIEAKEKVFGIVSTVLHCCAVAGLFWLVLSLKQETPKPTALTM